MISALKRIASLKTVFYGLLVVLELSIGVFVLINYRASLAVTAMVVSIPLIIINPKIGFFLCVLAVPFTGVHIFYIGKTNIEFIQPLLTLTCAIWFLNASVMAGPKFETEPRSINLALLVFILWIFITSTWSVNYFTGLFGVMKAIWVIALVPFAVSMIESQEDLKHTLLVWTLISVVVATMGIFTETHDYYGLRERAVGAAMHANILAMYLSLSLFLLIAYHQLCNFILAKILVLLAFAWVLAVMLATGSRGATIGFVAGISLVVVRLIVRRPGFGIILPIAGVVGVGLFLSVAPHITVETIVGRFVEVVQGGGKNTLSLRLLMWGACYSMIKSSHWMGIGINSYAKVMGQYRVLDLLNLDHPHSFYLYILVELGVLGAGIFGMLVFFVIRQLRLSMRKIESMGHRDALFSLAAGMVAFSIHGFVDFTIHDPQIWLYLGIMIAASRVLIKSQTAVGE